MRATGTANWGHETMIRPFRMTALKGALAVSLLMLAGLPAQRVQAQSDQWNALYDRIIRLEHEVRSIHLLSRRRLHSLFPDAAIRTERLLGAPKSFVAVGK